MQVFGVSLMNSHSNKCNTGCPISKIRTMLLLWWRWNFCFNTPPPHTLLVFYIATSSSPEVLPNKLKAIMLSFFLLSKQNFKKICFIKMTNLNTKVRDTFAPERLEWYKTYQHASCSTWHMDFARLDWHVATNSRCFYVGEKCTACVVKLCGNYLILPPCILYGWQSPFCWGCLWYQSAEICFATVHSFIYNWNITTSKETFYQAMGTDQLDMLTWQQKSFNISPSIHHSYSAFRDGFRHMGLTVATCCCRYKGTVTRIIRGLYCDRS